MPEIKTPDKKATGRPDKVLKVQETVLIEVENVNGEKVRRWIGHKLADQLVKAKKGKIVKK